MSKQRRWIKKHNRAERKDQERWLRQTNRFWQWYGTQSIGLNMSAFGVAGERDVIATEKLLKMMGVLL